MKARIVLHVNRDQMKYDIKKDSSSADMLLTRLVISLGVMLGFSLAVSDIKGAFMQSGPNTRELYVLPPKRFLRKLGYIRKLNNLP